MSLSTALNAAISGLQVSARGTQVVADNLANVDTPGYGPRAIVQMARAVGGTGSGVMFLGVARDTDPGLIGALRDAQSAQAQSETALRFWSDLENALNARGGVANRVNALDSALVQAQASPDNSAALGQVVQAAATLLDGIGSAAQVVATARDRADAQIAQDVQDLNALLAQTATLNRDIQRQSIAGTSPNALIDQRQTVIDQIGRMVPVREIPRDNGRVMLIAQDGTVLVDQQAVAFRFQRTPMPQPGDTVASGALGAVMLGNRALGAGDGPLQGGRIAAALHVRDHDSMAAQAALDRLAADLVTRFSGPATDATLAPGQFGLFRDRVALSGPVSVPGLSSRLALATALDPNDPSTFPALRDGLAATVTGPAGNTATLVGLSDALARPTQLDPGQPQRDLHGHAADLAQWASATRLRVEDTHVASRARSDHLAESLAAKGVDSDVQLQRLLVLEKTYAANARVIATVDTMMRTLLEI